jgi:hypothetical protein
MCTCAAGAGDAEGGLRQPLLLLAVHLLINLRGTEAQPAAPQAAPGKPPSLLHQSPYITRPAAAPPPPHLHHCAVLAALLLHVLHDVAVLAIISQLLVSHCTAGTQAGAQERRERKVRREGQDERARME